MLELLVGLLLGILIGLILSGVLIYYVIRENKIKLKIYYKDEEQI